jgi:CRP-like cAMP-binding protein/SAM-dependent methyltransferase
MDFLKAFADDQREIFLSGAEPMDLARGDYLLRHGEPGGDIFLLKTGTLEVVDTRTTPEVIVAVLEDGTMVGEMAFIDSSPRSVSVRAAASSEILRWGRDDLHSLLDRRPALAATFYETVAKVACARVRSLTEGAASGTFSKSEGMNQAGLARVKEEAREISENIKARFLKVETQLRADAYDEEAIKGVWALLDRLEGSLHELFINHPEPEAQDIAAKVLCSELHPYLVRSSLAERCIRRPQGVTGTAEILAPVLVNTAGGDGQLGEILDRWLLDRPTLCAIRSFREPTVELVARLLPQHRNRKALLINAGTGSLVAGLTDKLAHPPTILTVVDQSRDALAFLDAGPTSRPRGVTLETVQENLAQFAMGRTRHAFQPQDAIIVHGLLEYLPERIAVSLLTTCRELLTPDGVVVCSAFSFSDDVELLDRLLTWPTIRRSPEALVNILTAAGLELVERADLEPPAMLVAARAAKAS